MVAGSATVIGLDRTLEYFDPTIGHTFHLQAIDFGGNHATRRRSLR